MTVFLSSSTLRAARRIVTGKLNAFNYTARSRRRRETPSTWRPPQSDAMRMEFLCYHRDRPDSATLRDELLEEHWSYMDQYAKEMIARGPTFADDDTATGSLHIVDLPDAAAARAFAFDEPNYQAGVYRDVLVRRWRNLLGCTMWDFPGGRTGGNRYLVIGLGGGAGRRPRGACRPGWADRLRAAPFRRRHRLAGYGGAGPGT